MKIDEQLIKEKRIIEATKKEYQGTFGKFAVISRNLGDEIVGQGQISNNIITYDNFWNYNKEEKIGYLDEDTYTTNVGFYFYGLKYSMNLEIFYSENEKKIEVKYEGQTVYSEINGDLECYIPNENWENKIEELYKLAKPVDDRNKQINKSFKKKIFETKKSYILEYLKNKWGV